MTEKQSRWFDQINSIFNHKGMRRLWIKVRVVVVLLFAVLLIPLVQPGWFWVGLAVSLFGELIQLWCFASLDKNKTVARQGPYALVRNPMYLGRYFIVLGIILLLGAPGVYALVPYTVFYGFYMANRVKREEETLKTRLGADYLQYCEEVNRFLPSSKGVPFKSILFWNNALLSQNHGIQNAAGLLAAYVFFFIGTLFSYD